MGLNKWGEFVTCLSNFKEIVAKSFTSHGGSRLQLAAVGNLGIPKNYSKWKASALLNKLTNSDLQTSIIFIAINIQ